MKHEKPLHNTSIAQEEPPTATNNLRRELDRIPKWTWWAIPLALAGLWAYARFGLLMTLMIAGVIAWLFRKELGL